MLPRILLSLCLILLPTLALGADRTPLGAPGVPVNLEADQLSFDKETGRYQASGNVQLQQGETELSSRTLWWNQTSGELEAEGEVQLKTPGEELTGSKVHYNLQQGTGVVENGRIFLQDSNLHVTGVSIERRGKFEYRITDGTFTTCDGEVPSWKFGASRLDVTLGGYARARDAVFYLKDIPSFYLPYLVYPARAERESGLLMPSLGYSDRRGFQFDGAYYQVLGVNQDATLYLDVLSKLGIGTGLEYRYIFSGPNAGEARLYHIDVKDDDQIYALKWHHQGLLPGAVRMVADAEYVDNLNFFDNFGDSAAEYNKDKTQSIFFLSRNWGKNNLVGEVKFTKDLETDDPTTLQRLPRISFDIVRRRFGETPFYYSLAGEYNNFWRDQGLRGERLTVRPSLATSIQLGTLLNLAPEIGYREFGYWGMNENSDFQEDGVVDFSTRLTTSLERIYARPFGTVTKLRHSIEPEILYLYTPGRDLAQVPSFDELDRVDEANRIEYALVQRFTARFDQEATPPSYRDLLYLRLSQSYDLRSEAEQQPFSAIRGELVMLPTERTSLDIDATFDIDRGDWSKAAIAAAVHDQHENSFSAEYRSDRDEDIEYGALELGVAFLKPYYVNYLQRYDFSAGEQLEQTVGVEYRQQCWSALLTFTDRKDDQSIMLSFTMKGIGSVGGIGGGLGGI